MNPFILQTLIKGQKKEVPKDLNLDFYSHHYFKVSLATIVIVESTLWLRTLAGAANLDQRLLESDEVESTNL